MTAAANPWAELRARPHLELQWAALPDGTSGLWMPGVIVLDERLDRVQRRCTLMHELIHDERRVAWPDATAATMAKEEAIVRRETARRLVPHALLRRLLDRRRDVEPVTDLVVAAEFDVTTSVARLALSLVVGPMR